MLAVRGESRAASSSSFLKRRTHIMPTEHDRIAAIYTREGQRPGDVPYFPELDKIIAGAEAQKFTDLIVYDARVAISGVPPAQVARFIAALKQHAILLHESKPGGRAFNLNDDADELAFRRLAGETW
jgi:hypothetical protein